MNWFDKKPSETGRSGNNKKNDSNKGDSQPRKRKKNLTIHKTKIINPDNLPDFSRFLGYQDYFVQDIIIEPCNTRYRLARYQLPNGDIRIGKLPCKTHTGHFGHTGVFW